LGVDDPQGLEAFMREKGWLTDKERIVRCTVPGDGNMNAVVRIFVAEGEDTEGSKEENLRTSIVKQSPPYCYAFPSIAADAERSRVEREWYHLVDQRAAMKKWVPEIYHYDHETFVIHMEDLGRDCHDLTSAYTEGEFVDEEILQEIVRFLAELHNPALVDTITAEQRKILHNPDMRRIMVEHMFLLPLQADNGFDLDASLPGLITLSEKYKADEELAGVARQLSEDYAKEAAPGEGALLHGDFFPGAWFLSNGSLRIIDPEFSFVGPPEVDIGCMFGHLTLCGHSDETLEELKKLYCELNPRPLNDKLIEQLRGIEIVRRIIGIAQQPLHGVDIATRAALLEKGRRLILQL